MYFFNWLLQQVKRVSQVCKGLTRPNFHNIHFKTTGLELTIERSYQTHSHAIHFKKTGLVRRFSRRRNMPSSSIHGCYIIFGSQVKRKHILEQDELFCCAIISSGLIEKKKKLSFSLPWERQTPVFSLRVLNWFLLLGDPRILINLPKNWLSHSFISVKRLFRFSSTSAIRVLSCAYLRLLILLLAILIPACDSSSLDFTWNTLNRC